MIILETTRLFLKTIEKEDTDILHEKIFSNEETMRYTFGQTAFTLEETKKFLYKNFCKNNANVGLAPLFEKKSGLLVGLAGVLKFDELGANQYEFGFIIIDEYRRKGYATEIAKAQIIFTKKLLKQNSIFALAHKENIACKNLLIKLGMNYEKDIEVKNRGEREVYSKKL
jgi:RimJ/RimL family protein N-acetyltransferase